MTEATKALQELVAFFYAGFSARQGGRQRLLSNCHFSLPQRTGNELRIAG